MAEAGGGDEYQPECVSEGLPEGGHAGRRVGAAVNQEDTQKVPRSRFGLPLRSPQFRLKLGSFGAKEALNFSAGQSRKLRCGKELDGTWFKKKLQIERCRERPPRRCWRAG